MKPLREIGGKIKLAAFMGGVLLLNGCKVETGEPEAEAMLGNAEYLAMSYSGWRTTQRADELCPTVAEIREDLLLMEAMGVRMIRTYNTQLFPQTERILAAIRELKEADAGFEMYVMLGAWIQCEGIYTEAANHAKGDAELNGREIARAIELAEQYPDIVKIIAVGNEAMVTWQPHHVAPAIIHKWVKVLQEAREAGRLASDLWITTSDNWAALGGEESYRNDDLLALLRALDYVSLHTYAFHDTYYYPTFQWAIRPAQAGADPAEEVRQAHPRAELPVPEEKARAVERAVAHQKAQVAAVRAYFRENGIEKEIHIGETGWATRDDSHYGNEGTCAADEYTSKLFHDAVREWTESAGMSCFYFQAFDEPWKSSTPDGSESHFGLFTNEGQAKAVLWHLVDAGVFEGLGRSENPVTKTFDGDKDRLMETVLAPRVFKFQLPGEGAE
ncbi:MAG: glycosyl hydrolase family 17 [Oceanipulchritudo sp.]